METARLSNEIVTALLTAGIGSAAGALGAAWIIKRIEKRREKVQELESINAAIAITADIFNVAVIVKKQNIKSLLENYQDTLARLETYRYLRGLENTADIPFEMNMDMSNIDGLVGVRGDILVDVLFRNTNSDIQTLSLSSLVFRYINAFNDIMGKYNQIVDEFRSRREKDEDNIEARYLAQKLPGNQIDNRYKSLLKGLEIYLDSLIAFSLLLVKKLEISGQALRNEIGDNSLNLNKIDFKKAIDQQLIPDLKPYIEIVESLRPISESENQNKFVIFINNLRRTLI